MEPYWKEFKKFYKYGLENSFLLNFGEFDYSFDKSIH